jgi:hypothetical protein
LIGKFKNGVLEGDGLRFYYPDGTFILGNARNGHFVSGVYYKKNGTILKKLRIDLLEKGKMPKYLTDSDPYEDKYVYSKEVPGKGEGLFCKRRIKKGNLVSLYAGKIISSGFMLSSFKLPPYKIELNDHLSIDIPAPFNRISKYRATLGHKANHSFMPNSEFTQLFHPKFGEINEVIALRDIEEDEEIVTDYNYEFHQATPKWYIDYC